MPNGKDPNWKQMIVDIHGDVKEIKTNLKTVTTECEDHEDRLRELETAKATANGYREAKEKFYEKHPVKTAVGGSVTIGAIVTAVLALLTKLGALP